MSKSKMKKIEKLLTGFKPGSRTTEYQAEYTGPRQSFESSTQVAVYYLLVTYIMYCTSVDVGLRSYTSFQCPTRCKHRGASWQSRLYQHRQHAMVVNSYSYSYN